MTDKTDLQIRVQAAISEARKAINSACGEHLIPLSTVVQASEDRPADRLMAGALIMVCSVIDALGSLKVVKPKQHSLLGTVFPAVHPARCPQAEERQHSFQWSCSTEGRALDKL